MSVSFCSNQKLANLKLDLISVITQANETFDVATPMSLEEFKGRTGISFVLINPVATLMTSDNSSDAISVSKSFYKSKCFHIRVGH